MTIKINESAPRAGKTVYGASLGILMLDTKFPRIHGDIGNAETWPFPVIYKVVEGATSDKVVRKGAFGLKDSFEKAAKDVVSMGADGIGTTCGFLSLFQDDISKAAGVPVASSSLMQVPWVQRTLPPGARVGVITISKESVTPAHLAAVGVPLDTPIVGTEGGKAFTKSVLDDGDYMDFDLASKDLVNAGHQLVSEYPNVKAIVLECTNMGPFSRDINLALGLPVFDVISYLTWFHAGLRPRRYQL
jgi:Asp/Glu/hydantoin racemase